MRRFRVCVVEDNPGTPTHGRVVFAGPFVPEAGIAAVADWMKTSAPILRAVVTLKQALGAVGVAVGRTPPPRQRKGARTK